MSRKTKRRPTEKSVITQTQNDTPNDKIEKATKTWKLVLVACSLIGTGFWAGLYVGYNNSKIESQDKINEYRERIIELGQEHEKKIHDYNRENI